MQIVLYILFILSGVAGLMYESVWSRYLSLFVGHSAYAQIIVLTIFLGGMALGAILIARSSKKVAEPLVWYAYIEMLVGVLGLAFHTVFSTVTTAAYDSLFPAMAGSPLLLATKWLIAALLILPQSILLGTTFPLMSAGVIRFAPKEPGRVLSLLYFSNSLGAAAGVLIAGFWMIRLAGLPGTVTAAAILNIVVGVGCLATTRYLLPYVEARARRKDAESTWLRSNLRPSHATPTGTIVSEETLHNNAPDVAELTPSGSSPVFVRAVDGDRAAYLGKLLLAVSFGTAVASFIYEIAWIRMLSLVLGSATHSFEIMLSAFILGLSLGAFWVRKRADTFRDPVAALGTVQWLMGAAALATLPIYLQSFQWTSDLLNAVGRNDAGYTIFNVVRYGVCLAVMLPSTFLAGMTLPLITRTLFKSERGESAIGTVYGVNTLGSITGVALAGLVLMPLLGVKYLLISGAVLDMALGVALLAYSGRGFQFANPRPLVATGLLGVALVLAMTTSHFDRTVLSSGVFRSGNLPIPGSRNIVYYKDGRTASVSVNLHLSDSLTVISTNGKPDASLDAPWFRPKDTAPEQLTALASDVSTQLLLPLVTLAHNPQSRVAAVIGHGSGMSSHFLLGSPTLEELYTIEIEPSMIEGSRHFLPANARVFDDPRSHFIIDDAKSYFAATGTKFDLILSEPSNPWVSGVSGLFTAEFYNRVKRYLAEDGVFGQWLHLYEINDGLVLSVLAAIHHNFPSYEIFQTSSGDILIVASLRDTMPAADWEVFTHPGIVQDLSHAIPFDSLTLDATRVLSRDVLAPLLDEWTEPNSDYYPVLDLGTERARFQRELAAGFSAMWTQGFNVSAALMSRRAGARDAELAVMPGLGTIFSRAMSARARRGGPALEGEEITYPGLGDFLHREWAFRATLATSTPPEDWHRWAVSFIDIEEDLHRGASGFVDSSFYADVIQYVNRFDAPRELLLSIRFLKAVAEWDWAEVASSADTLAAMTTVGSHILATDFLMDAGTVALLKQGDVDGAREFYSALVGYGSRSPNHFQSRLLDAHLRAAERRRLAGEPVIPLPGERR